uniref:Bardet-Biedl syndrome 9 n=1 Tax=Naja naja TaxID=35670 RepID=A0A8C6Y7L8_NAJNA
MSLFKAREWWSTIVGNKEEFDQGCLCVANVDNSSSVQDKIIVGSYMGFLRIYNPHPIKPGHAMQAEDMLLEVQLCEPILQVEVGKFVSGTELLHLAVLHCKKLCVYAVSGSLGNTEHGNQYQLKRMYEHNLYRTAYNMTHGPFGGIKGQDLICVQSVDGMLMLFEQESYSFGRFLPGFLLPGPLTYSSRTDSFITVSSCRQVESYRYQVLALAKDAEIQETEQQKIGSGKKLVVDWISNIGEQALDVCVVSFKQLVSSIFVLGERNLFCFKDNGQIRFIKKLDHSPSCFLPYSVCGTAINTLIGNHNSILHVYQDVTLKWATQLPHIPVVARLGKLLNLKGVIVTLSDSGYLQCSYLGTDPSLFQAPKVEARNINYAEYDEEMNKLQKIIKEVRKIKGNFYFFLNILNSDGSLNGCALFPIYLFIVLLVLTESSVSKTVVLSAFRKGNFLPADLEGSVIASYNTATGAPRVAQCTFRLPLRLVCFPAQPSKTASQKLTIDTNKPTVSLITLFSDFADQIDEDQLNVLGFQLLAGSRITLLASKTSQRYRIQSDQLEDLWLITKELTLRLEQHFGRQNCKDFVCTFSGPIPLQDYFDIIDHHFELRLNAMKYEQLLAERAIQFRAIERRLLTRFKDKTPAPLQHLDTLLEGTYRQVIALADAAEENQAIMFQAFTKLKSATQLLILLISLWQKLSVDQVAILEATFLPLTQNTQELGWEETVDASISHLLKTCLSKSSKDHALTLFNQLCIPKDTNRLKKHITLLFDRLAKGGRMSLNTDLDCHQPMLLSGKLFNINLLSSAESHTDIYNSTFNNF